MFLLCLTVCSVLSGSLADVSYERKCYGSDLKIPDTYSPPLFKGSLLFSPASDGAVKILMSNGEVKDRVKVSYSSVYLYDLTENDEGSFLVSFGGVTTHKIISLKVIDCAEEITRYHGSMFAIEIPRQAEYLEFTPLSSKSQITVLWNRTNSQRTYSGAQLPRRTKWEKDFVTQADNGYYTLRRKDEEKGTVMLSRKKLSVQAEYIQRQLKESSSLYIAYPSFKFLWTVTYQPVGDAHKTLMMKAGQAETYDYWNVPSFMDRVNIMTYGIEMSDLTHTDSGTWEFRDENGNLAKSVEVDIPEEPIASFAIGIIAVVAAAVVLMICCCVRKHCCKKSSCKRDEPQRAAAPAVSYRDQNQPAGPHHPAASTRDYSHPQMNLLNYNKEPSAVSSGPLAGVVGGGGQREVNNPLNINVNPAQPEVAPAGQQSAAPAVSVGSNFLLSDSEPTFELKGPTFASGPPLSSDSPFCDVYTSDKLNFP